MFSFTAQHILVMRLIIQFEITSPALMHNFLFLSSADSLDPHEIGFYDFIRTRNGAFSPTLQSILEELAVGRLLTREPFALSAKGMDTYCALASALKPFEDYMQRCFTIYMRYKDDLASVNSAIKDHIRFRKAKQGKKLFSL
ncbi:MAG: hypothetical protein CVU89_11510 [Firmicutes bacterium HGW-Firmicutes-14]|nr:MAG: hypothetical protein CVU89_11510 [Firmicutes bacterium HGW-Firmicutes-14]